MLKLDGVATFVAIAEAGSISEAARRLRLAKSVVSERLAELERSLGSALLHRTTRGLALTEDGTAFLERAARIVREVYGWVAPQYVGYDFVTLKGAAGKISSSKGGVVTVAVAGDFVELGHGGAVGRLQRGIGCLHDRFVRKIESSLGT